MKNIEFITLKENNIDDFAEARNKLLDTSRSEWVFFVDSDETISKELKKEIEDLDPKDFSGFYVKRNIFFLGQRIGTDRVLRLGKKNAGRWKRKVHEVWKINGNIGVLKNYITHKTAKDLHTYLEKMNKYSDIHASENLRERKRSNLIKIICYPKLKFVQNILSGRGLVFSLMQSLHSFLGWAKQWELQKK